MTKKELIKKLKRFKEDTEILVVTKNGVYAKQLLSVELGFNATNYNIFFTIGNKKEK